MNRYELGALANTRALTARSGDQCLTGTERLQLYGSGPWDTEPDRLEWRAHGVVCLMVRQPQLGHWCGYVGVTPDHPWVTGSLPDDANELVHFELNYVKGCNGPVCHVPEPGEADHLVWLGFDCAHHTDLCPGTLRSLGEPYSPDVAKRFGTYRDVDYVRRHVEQLAERTGKAARA